MQLLAAAVVLYYCNQNNPESKIKRLAAAQKNEITDVKE